MDLTSGEIEKALEKAIFSNDCYNEVERILYDIKEDGWLVHHFCFYLAGLVRSGQILKQVRAALSCVADHEITLSGYLTSTLASLFLYDADPDLRRAGALAMYYGADNSYECLIKILRICPEEVAEDIHRLLNLVSY